MLIVALGKDVDMDLFYEKIVMVVIARDAFRNNKKCKLVISFFC